MKLMDVEDRLAPVEAQTHDPDQSQQEDRCPDQGNPRCLARGPVVYLECVPQEPRPLGSVTPRVELL
jgi:hypothetical protein